MSRKLVKVEFHSHSEYSYDSLVRVADLIKASKKKGLNRLAITDHNSVQGALLAKEIDPELVIIGEEIQTSEFEIIGYFLKELVPKGLSPMRTVEKLKKQNAFISIPHPFDRQRSTFWKPSLMKEILPYLDAIEVFNARCVLPAYNKQAEAFANENGKLKLAGSDAHSTIELGKASLLLPEFHDAESLRISLLDYEFDGDLSSPLVHILSSYAKLAKRFKKIR